MPKPFDREPKAQEVRERCETRRREAKEARWCQMEAFKQLRSEQQASNEALKPSTTNRERKQADAPYCRWSGNGQKLVNRVD